MQRLDEILGDSVHRKVQSVEARNASQSLFHHVHTPCRAHGDTLPTIPSPSLPFSHLGPLPLHEIQRGLPIHHSNTTRLITIPYTIAFLRDKQHLRAEGRADELAAAVVCALGQGLEHVGDGGAVLGVEIGVDLVEEVERSRVALLDGEDESEGAETWGVVCQ